MKKCIRTLFAITGAVLFIFSFVPNAHAEEVQTPVTVELTKAISPETYPVNSGGTTATPNNTETVATGGNTGTIARSSLGKQLPQTGDTENYWSLIGWLVLLGFTFLVLKRRKVKQI